MPGMHGWVHVNRAMQECDVLVQHRRPIRRPRHRQGVDLRPARQGHPRRHRSERDRQERQGPRPDRGRRQTGAHAAPGDAAQNHVRRRRRGSKHIREMQDTYQPKQQVAQSSRHGRAHAARRLRGLQPGAARARRTTSVVTDVGPASDVGGPAARVVRAAHAHHQRRLRHHGLFRPGRDGRGSGSPRRHDLGDLSAMAAFR